MGIIHQFLQKPHLRSALLLTLILFLATAMRAPQLGMPLERDEGEYAYMGQLLLSGIPPYREAYNMKLPGAYVLYGAAELVFGQNIFGVRLGMWLYNLLTIVALHFLARRILKESFAWWATLFFAIFSQSPNLLANMGHATGLINLCAVPGFLCLAAFQEKKRFSYLVAGGLLLGCAFVVKQQAITLCLAALVWTALHPGPRGKNLAALALALATPFLLVCATLFLTGDFASFWFWTFAYASKYAAANPLLDGYYNFMGVWQELRLDLVLWMLAALGALACLFRRYKLRSLLLLWLLGAVGTTLPGFVFRQHYFITLVPVCCLLAALALQQLGAFFQRTRQAPGAGPVEAGSIPDLSRPAPGGRKYVPQLVGAAVATLMVLAYGQSFWAVSADRWLANRYGQNPFLESVALASYLANRTSPGDKIAVVGSEPQVYFYANRRSATGYLYGYPLMEEQPYALTMQKELAADLERNRPKMVAVEYVPFAWLLRQGSSRFIFSWLDQYLKQYKLVAVLELHPSGPVWVYDPQGVYTPRTPNFITIYQRKN